jgi:hypothetical protein
MRRMLLIALAGTLLAACAMPDSTPHSARDAARNLQSTQPDRSASK